MPGPARLEHDRSALQGAGDGQWTPYVEVRAVAALKELEGVAESLTATPPGPDLIDANWRFHHIVNTSAGVPHLLPLLRQAVRLIPSNFLACPRGRRGPGGLAALARAELNPLSQFATRPLSHSAVEPVRPRPRPVHLVRGAS